jgi:hypothetical protein
MQAKPSVKVYRSVSWMEPERLVPPHAVTKPKKVKQLVEDITAFGWWGEPLLAYWTWDRRERRDVLQLLSGSHRWAAMLWLGMRVPVVTVPEQEVVDAWGDVEKWSALMQVGHEHEWLIRREYWEM